MKLFFELNETKDGLVVASGEDTKGKVAIPSEHEFEGNMYSVKEIGSFAFDRCEDLESIEVPSSVTKIGRCAFYGCTSLESIIIPDSVTKIGLDAFSDCKNMKEIVVNDASLLENTGVPKGVKIVKP